MSWRSTATIALTASLPSRVITKGRWQLAAVVSDSKVAGERQRLNLAHELGHLVLDVTALADEQVESAAFRFGSALLVPAAVLRKDVGNRRNFISTEELLLLKQRFGMSMQALLYRLRNLGIITRSPITNNGVWTLIDWGGGATNRPACPVRSQRGCVSTSCAAWQKNC